MSLCGSVGHAVGVMLCVKVRYLVLLLTLWHTDVGKEEILQYTYIYCDKDGKRPIEGQKLGFFCH